MNASLDTLGLDPIPGANPAGDGVRADDDFDRLQSEIDKLNNPGSSGSTDWDVVQRAAVALLSEKGKDLLVACYLGGALLRRAELAGLAAGLKVVDDLLRTYWDTLYPALARLRARRNALSWLFERAQQHVAERVDRDLLQEPDVIEALTSRLASIENCLGEKDPDAPSVRPLLSAIRSLPVREIVVAAPVVEAAAPSVGESEGWQTSVPSPDGAARVGAVRGAAGPGPAVAPLPTTPIVSDADAGRAFDQIAERLVMLADWRRGNRSNDVQAYRLNRVAAWGVIEGPPPSERGQTRIPGPIPELAIALDRLQSGDAPEDTLGFAESNLPAYPFWLDLNRASAQALSRLGEPFADALAEVNAATVQLLRRVPGLPNLAFADGKPFADGTTLEWIGSLQRGSGAGAAAPDAFDVALGSARSLAAEGNLEAAALTLQGSTLTGGPEQRLRASIHLAGLMLAHRPNAALRPFAMGLLSELDRHNLDHWTPSLALEALTTAHALLAQSDLHAEALPLIERIARIDPPTAVRLTLGA
jgi:type VI secretion system protein VasJ